MGLKMAKVSVFKSVFKQNTGHAACFNSPVPVRPDRACGALDLNEIVWHRSKRTLSFMFYRVR